MDHGRGMRLAELVPVLSLGTDLALGQRVEHLLRQRLIAPITREGTDAAGSPTGVRRSSLAASG